MCRVNIIAEYFTGIIILLITTILVILYLFYNITTILYKLPYGFVNTYLLQVTWAINLWPTYTYPTYVDWLLLLIRSLYVHIRKHVRLIYLLDGIDVTDENKLFHKNTHRNIIVNVTDKVQNPLFYNITYRKNYIHQNEMYTLSRNHMQY